MPIHNSEYLLDRLLNHALSETELDAFLVGLHDPARAQAYSDVLEIHFDKLLLDHRPQTEADGFPDQPEKPPASATDAT